MLKGKSFWLLISALAIVLGVFLYQKYQTHILNEQNKARAVEIQDRKNPTKATTLNEFRSRLLFIGIDETWATYPTLPKESNWYQKEKERYRDLSKGKKYDLIVLPVQESRPGADRVSRLTIAKFVADEIRRRSDISVMPVELAQRLLGERSYKFSDSDIELLETKYGLNSVVHLYLDSRWGDSQKSSLGFALTKKGKLTRKKVYSFASATDEYPLELRLWDLIGNYVTDFFPKLEPTARPIIVKSTERVEIPQSMDQMLEDTSNPILQALNLQLIGMLTSKHVEYERRRLFERSLVALRGVDSRSDHYRIILARALHYLYRRPAAVRALDGANKSEELAFLDYLNGNYYSLKERVRDTENPIFKLFAYLELHELKYAYGKNSEAEPALLLPRDNWQRVIENRTRDGDIWYTPRNVGVMKDSAGLFSGFDTYFKGLLKQKAVSGELELYGDESDLVLEKVWESILEDSKEELCCKWGMASVDKYDLYHFFRNIGLANLVRNLHKKSQTQAIYPAALKTATIYERMYAGHISIASLKAAALFGMTKKSKGSEREYYAEQCSSQAGLAHSLAGGTDSDSIRAEHYGRAVLRYRKSDPSRIVTRGIGAFSHVMDRPSKNLYYERSNDPSALKYTVSRFEILKSAVKNARKVKQFSDEMLDSELENRFDGHPGKIPFLADRLLKKGDKQAAVRLLEKGIKDKNSSWQVYKSLGDIYAQDRRYKEASDTYMLYPPFSKEKPERRVYLSNYAYKAANVLYWQGAYKEATPLFEISANLNTGSGAEMISEQRLALIDKNYIEAASHAYRQGRRYNSAYGYSEYLSYLHLFGFEEQAFSGFDELNPRYNEPYLWTSQFIGQRIQNIDPDELANWLVQYKKNVKQPYHKSMADRFIFLQSVVDRPTSEHYLDLIKRVGEESPGEGHMPPMGSRLIVYFDDDLPKSDNKNVALIPVNCPPDSPACREDHAKKRPNYHESVYRAYHLLRTEKYIESFNAFIEHANYYDFGIYGAMTRSYSLPYFAITAIKTGNEKRLDKYLKEFEERQGKNFDYYLSKAVVSAVKSDSDSAIDYLHSAFARVIGTEERPMYVQYQIVELGEWIYEETDDKRFLELALNWARNHQVIQPQFAWAYAFEAKHSNDESNRIRAAAFASHLDPRSFWLSQVSKRTIEKAQAWWKTNNPFVQPAGQEENKTDEKQEVKM